MMERLLKIKDSLVLYLTNELKSIQNKSNEISISPENWKTMETCVKILKPFEEITRQLSNSNAIISSVIPLIHALKLNLEVELSEGNNLPVIRKFLQTLIFEINGRFSELHKMPVYAIATYLDPRYKFKFFDTMTKDYVQGEVVKLIIADVAEVQISSPTPNKKTKTTTKPNSQQGTSEVHYNSSQIHISMQNYLNAHDSDTEDDTEEGTFSISHAKAMLSNYNKEKKFKYRKILYCGGNKIA